MPEETGEITGTKDKDYNIIWFTEQCLSNVLRLESYASDAERDGDSDLAEFFKRAQEASRRGAEGSRTSTSVVPFGACMWATNATSPLTTTCPPPAQSK